MDNGNSTEVNIAKLLSSIENTMSDLDPVNPFFNSQLKSARENVIPKALGNWDDLSEVSKSQLGKMGNCFCKLHLQTIILPQRLTKFYIILSKWFCGTVMSLCLLSTKSSLLLTKKLSRNKVSQFRDFFFDKFAKYLSWSHSRKLIPNYVSVFFTVD